MSANTRLVISELDFDTILQNMQNFYQGQTVFSDYNFQASGLQVLLKNLSYNTHYLSYYLNMLSNEMGISSAIVRDNISRAAKSLNYLPGSMTSPSAFVNVIVTPPPNTINVGSTLIIPQYTPFQSQAINGQNFTYVTTEASIASYFNGNFTFNSVELNEGEVVQYQYTAATSNPRSTFNIPNANIDTSTLLVNVTENTPAPPVTIPYVLVQDVSLLDGNSRIFYLEGATSNTYNIYFGDGILGRALIPGDVVTLNYLVTFGDASNGANSFTIMNPVGSYGNVVTQSVSASGGGGAAETDSSIKMNAPLAYTTQNRAVTAQDYAFLLNRDYNNIGSMNVWGGGENNPPVYGAVFIAIKPKFGNYLSTLQKQQVSNIISKYILPGTVLPQIVDPDYVYLLPNIHIVYNPNLTNLTVAQLKFKVQQAIYSYVNTNLSKFNGIYVESQFTKAVTGADPSIIGCDAEIFLQKRFYPALNSSQTYILNYHTPLHRGGLNEKLYSSPGIIINDSFGNPQTCFIEENINTYEGITNIIVNNPGAFFTGQPQVIINGDGFGASAHAVIVNGSLQSVVLDQQGEGYNFATAQVVGGGGFGAVITPILAAQNGILDTYYFTSTSKVILNPIQGIVDHVNGIITINNFAPIDIQNQTKQFNINIKPDGDIIVPGSQCILLIDQTDPNAIQLNLVPFVS